jgi:hypothetical protein
MGTPKWTICTPVHRHWTLFISRADSAIGVLTDRTGEAEPRDSAPSISSTVHRYTAAQCPLFDIMSVIKNQITALRRHNA